MLDIKFIRDNTDVVRMAIKNKNSSANLDHLLSLDDQRRKLLTSVENLRAQRNEINEKLKSGKDDELIAQSKTLKADLGKFELELEEIGKQWGVEMLKVPNIPTSDTPIGTSDKDNVVAKKVGEPKKFDFPVKDHWQLAQNLDLIDKERAAKVAGSRFAYIKGDLVRLQFALMQFTADQLTNPKIIKKIIKANKLKVSDKPFVPILPPALIKTEIYQATARLNGTDVTYKLENDDLWLNASAEHSLCPMYQNETLDESQFPIRYLGYTTAFRREAGTYGKDMEGIFRMHQFDKLEMESFATKEEALNEHLLLVGIQEYLMSQLDIPYQLLLKCTADIGDPNARGMDIESWLPGQDKYRETHTADYMTDFQARRLNTKVRRADGNTELVHTNDATAFALGRTMIAILENYQQEDGSILVPKVLQKYTGFDVISKN